MKEVRGYNITNEKDGREYIEVPCPGFEKEELSVYAQEGMVHVAGTVLEEPSDVEYAVNEFKVEDFKMGFKVFSGAKVTHVSLMNGVLCIELTRPTYDTNPTYFNIS